MPSQYVESLNGTLILRNDCTFATCDSRYAFLNYAPNFALNLVYLIFFGILLLAHTALVVRYRTWGFYVAMLGGIVGEIVGYVGRLMLNNNAFEFNNFITYLVPITIAPAFMTAGIYLCLGRIINIYGSNTSRLAPKTYTFVFVSCDLISLVLQAAGGAIASIANTQKTSNMGVNIMIAGLSFQVFSITLFLALWGEYILRLRRTPSSEYNPTFAAIRANKLFTYFQFALVTATIFIFIRCIFRVAELSKGFSGPIANNQVLFSIFEGPMILIAVALLAVLHPGIGVQGRDTWAAAGWHFSAKKERAAALANQERKERDVEGEAASF